MRIRGSMCECSEDKSNILNTRSHKNMFTLSFLPTGAEIKVRSENKHGFGLRYYRKG